MIYLYNVQLATADSYLFRFLAEFLYKIPSKRDMLTVMRVFSNTFAQCYNAIESYFIGETSPEYY